MSAIVGKFKKDLNNLWAEICKKNAFQGERLHHYTSYEGLKGILTSRTLWLTAYPYLNDPREIVASLEIIKVAIEDTNKPDSHWKEKPRSPLDSYRNTKKHKLVSFKKLFLKLDRLIKPRTSPLNKEQFGSKCSDEKENIHKTIPYVFSFCEQSDYDYVWEKYGDNKKGFSIEFKKEFFQPNGAPAIEPDGASHCFHLCKVSYEKKSFLEKINSLLELACNSKNPKKSIYSSNDLLACLITLLPLFKEGEHQHEKEIRLVGTGVWLIADLKNKKPKEWYFKRPPNENSKGLHVPTIRFPFPLEWIEKIWVGANCDADKEAEIRKLANDLGLGIPVCKSKSQISDV